MRSFTFDVDMMTIRRLISSFNVFQLITTAGTFWMYSVFCALATIFVMLVVPETKGRDLDSIAKLFVKNSNASQDVPAAMTAGDKLNGHLTTTHKNSKVTSIELHVPVSEPVLVPASNATPNIETNKLHANLEITKM